MRECPLPENGAPLSSRTLAACVAAILEVPVETVPCPAEGSPWPQLGWWLLTRNLAPVPVRDPKTFQWGGWWIARRGEVHVLMAGLPSGIVWEPAPAPDQDELLEGWVLAPPALPLPRDPSRRRGTVAGIFRAAASDGAMDSLDRARLLAGVGVEGDRYALGAGRFSSKGRSGQALTLVEAETLEELRLRHGLELAPAAARRNVLTRGIDLNSMPGLRFRIGEVECYAQRLAEPCSWLQRTAPPGTLRGLVHRGGLRVDILTSGEIRLGDEVGIDGDRASTAQVPRPTPK